MDINLITIIVGSIFVIITISLRILRLKKKFLKKLNLMSSFGYVIISFMSALVIVRMINLAILTVTNNLTLELIQQNKDYIFLVWLVMGLAALVAYISLLFEEKKDSD